MPSQNVRGSRLRQPTQTSHISKGLSEISESQGNARSTKPSMIPPPTTLKHKLGQCEWKGSRAVQELELDGSLREIYRLRAGTETQNSRTTGRRVWVERASHTKPTSTYRERHVISWRKCECHNIRASSYISLQTSPGLKQFEAAMPDPIPMSQFVIPRMKDSPSPPNRLHKGDIRSMRNKLPSPLIVNPAVYYDCRSSANVFRNLPTAETMPSLLRRQQHVQPHHQQLEIPRIAVIAASRAVLVGSIALQHHMDTALKRRLRTAK